MTKINTTLLDNIAFAVIVKNEEYLEKFKPQFFEEEIKQDLVKLIKTHHEKFKEIPTSKQLTELYKFEHPTSDLSIISNFVNHVYNFDLREYTKDWIDESMKAYISVKQLDTSVKDLLMYLKTTNINMSNVGSVLNTARGIIESGTEVSFGFNEGFDVFNPESYKLTETTKLNSGFDFFNFVTNGGFARPGLIVYTAPPKCGKTLLLTNTAVNMINCGLNGVLVSCEMPAAAMLNERFGPAMFNITTSDFKELAENPLQLGKIIQNFKNSSIGMGDSLFDSLHPGEFFIKEYPTSTLTVPELEIYLKKLIEVKKIKLDFVVLDYINIMSNYRNPNSENTYMKIKQISEDLRAMSQRLGITIVTATQTKRGTEESADYGTADIAEASSLSHTVDMMVGLIQTPEMYANKEYFIKILLNRYGGHKNARKRFTVDYTKMKIFETNEPIIEDFFNQ